MTRVLKLFAALAVVTHISAEAASAGGNGVRLGFGMPLGTFTATPAHGGSGGQSYAASPRKAAAKAHRAPAVRTPATHVARAKPKLDKPVEENVATSTSAEETVSAPGATQAFLNTDVSAAKKPDPAPATEPAPEAKTDVATNATPPSEPATIEKSQAEAQCTKFIPSIGATVSVACEK